MDTKRMLVAAFIAIAGAASPALQAHTRLESSSPQANAVLAKAPQEIRLRFSEPLELPFSKVKLLDRRGSTIAPSRIEADRSNQKVLVAALPVLKPGPYRVQWTTVTRDGHKVKGEFGFTVK